CASPARWYGYFISRGTHYGVSGMHVNITSGSFVAITALTLTSSALASIIHVPADQPTIQAAINAAVTNDTILVAPGIYGDPLNFGGKPLTLISESGPNVTSIDLQVVNASGNPSSVKRAITIPAPLPRVAPGSTTTIDGFKITNGWGPADPTAILGGGFHITGGNTVIRNCVITNNRVAGQGSTSLYGRGGGLYAVNATLTIDHCVFDQNQSWSLERDSSGAGAFVVDSTLLMSCTVFTSNNVNGTSCCGSPPTNSLGGALHVSGGTAEIVNSVFAYNTLHGSNCYGGALACEGAGTTLNLVNCIINNNKAFDASARGGGISARNSAVLNVSNCTIAYNSGTEGFPSAIGGIYNAATVSNSIIELNAGVQIAPGATVTNSCVQDGYSGTGNISADPLFIDAANGNFRLQDNSPCRDTGDRSLLPFDTLDLDNDGNTTELLSLDFDLNRRIVNNQVDMGAFEWQSTCLADISPSSPGVAGDHTVNINDLTSIILAWGTTCDQCVEDITNDGLINIDDLTAVILAWGRCP
ncbi:MAG TPA: hypothetical protein VG711_12995, partial [Phycisphaerales bacterium]|nr:hypothetical protein [Phycisphaerales bacterium]